MRVTAPPVPVWLLALLFMPPIDMMPALDEPVRAAAMTLPAAPPATLELVLIVTCGKRMEPPLVEPELLVSVVRLPLVVKL